MARDTKENTMREIVLYIHGKNGAAAESEHYAPLFPGDKVIGLDYQTFTPWETGREILDTVLNLQETHGNVTLIANSIGAFFSMNAGIDAMIRRAYFISPIYGENDNLTSSETMRAFAERHNAALTVMKGGEHWFHTEEQMRFLDNWIRKGEGAIR